MCNQRRFLLTSSALAAILCVAATLTATAASRANVAVSVDRQMLSRALVEQEILRQAKAQGVRLSPSEARSAADQAMNDLTSKAPGPQKLIIHLKFRKFTICISTGADKGYCKGGGRTAKK